MADLIKYGDSLRQGTDKLNESIKASGRAETKSDEALGKAGRALDNSESTQEQLDTIVIEGDSSVEAAQARVDEKGESHSTLKARIDDGFEKTNAQLAETVKVISHGSSYVDKLEKLIKIKGMYLRSDSENVHVGINMSNGLNPVVEYHFKKNDDGLLLLRGVRSGVEDDLKNLVDVVLEGNFNTNSPSSVFTTTIDDYFTFEFTGRSLFFERGMEERGGLWEFELSNGMKRTVSCFIPSSSKIFKKDIIFDDLPYGHYTGKATFKGGVDGTPSGVTPRGYLRYKSDDPSYNSLSTSKLKPINEDTAKYITPPNSILDFAISARPDGASYSTEWVPQHGSKNGVSSGVHYKIYVDGEMVASEPNEMESFEFIEITDFEITQKFDATNPNGSDGVLWTHYVNHSIRKRSPYLTIQNKMIMKQDTYVGSLYFGMLASLQSTMEYLNLNNGKEYYPLKTDDSEEVFGLDVTSALYRGAYGSGNFHGVAVDISSLKEAVNFGREYQPKTVGRLTFRSDDVAKVYWVGARQDILKTGDVFSCQHRICGVSGIRFPNEYIESVV